MEFSVALRHSAFLIPHLQIIVVFQQIFCHSKEHKRHGVKVHVQVFAEAHAVLEDGHVEPLQALEGTMEIEALQFLLRGFVTYVGL